ncbi:MAG: type VI secretion protein IcmF/TssM N-terminal domain-containing protein, partial [Pirellulales bacterium]|nr:type VI secretion protein IcmF/TssM N-terminal domain-containing protein [Pirellulales bacterium]
MGFFRQLLNAVTYPLRALFASPARLFAAGQRLSGLSLPARAAILVAVFLVISVITALVAFRFTQDHVAMEYWFNPVRVIVIAILVVVIPIVVYYVLQLWLEGDRSRYPDIDAAWRAGLAQLQQRGLSPARIPLFLVAGTACEAEENALFRASCLELPVKNVPGGAAALRWYANSDGIYLVCSETSSLSRLASSARGAAGAGQSPPARPAARPSHGALRGTIISQPADVEADQPAEERPPDAGLRPAEDRIRGTMVMGAGRSEAASPADQRRAVVLTADERAEQQRRLEYLCGLIRRLRQPYCPINGILTLLPWDLIQHPREALELRRSVQADLETIRRTLLLRCPVTALVSGVEREPGFCEMIRRVGAQRAGTQRFGKGFSVWNPPTRERLVALTAHACAAFEDCIYALFRETGALGKPGNTKLYALLCRVRRDVQDRLAHVLVGGYGRGEGGSAD